MSYPISYGSPAKGNTVAEWVLWVIRVTAPVITVQCLRTRRSGTTTCRGSMDPAAASGRNGW